MKTVSCWLPLLLSNALVSVVHGYYLPGVNPQSFIEEQE